MTVSFEITLYKADTSIKRTLSGGLNGVRFIESWLYCLLLNFSLQERQFKYSLSKLNCFLKLVSDIDWFLINIKGVSVCQVVGETRQMSCRRSETNELSEKWDEWVVGEVKQVRCRRSEMSDKWYVEQVSCWTIEFSLVRQVPRSRLYA